MPENLVLTSRRRVLSSLGAVLVGSVFSVTGARSAPTALFGGRALRAELRKVEQERGGRLGVSILDTHDGRALSYRGRERFPLCSTFKLLLCGAVLAQVDARELSLEQLLDVHADDLVEHSPAVEKHVNAKIAVRALCEATLTLSDNAAANLLLPLVGGPRGLTRFVRTLGDRTTRLDRTEPSLGEATPGDPRDTTSPDAMRASMQRLLLGSALSETSRGLLIDWLVANKTGNARLRAGCPTGWRVGDKTGTGMHGSTNDVAIVWPPARKPLLVTCYLTECAAAPEARNAAHASVARALAAHLA
jgi:beta-lactamase class A